MGLQIDLCDGEAFANLFQFHFRAGVYASRRDACARKLRRQRHGEAAGVSCANQLFRVGGRLAFFKSGLERVGAVKGTAAEFQSAAPFGEMPFHSASAFRVGMKPSFDLLLLFWWVQF